jgi:hypothetical protein
MSRILRVGKNRKVETLRGPKADAWPTELDGLDVRVALIQALIPLGLQAVADVLETEVTALA